MTRIAILAAMPGELKPLVRGWQHQRRRGVDLWRKATGEAEWVAACAGVGSVSASHALLAAESFGPLDRVVSTGWAGALTPELEAGRAYWVSGVIDAETGERFATASSLDPRWLVSTPTVADAAEKKNLAGKFSAALVDMEAATVARMVSQRQIPFYAVKGVSDAYDAKLPDFSRFLSANGRFRMVPFVLFALFRPVLWPSLVQMGENSNRAAKSLAEALLDFFEERAHPNERNGNPEYTR
jgi:adenosylhomocysteine nucleosidase